MDSNEINELRERLAQLERATMPAQPRKQLTTDQRREIIAQVNEAEGEWFRTTTAGKLEQAELVAARAVLQAETKARVQKINIRLGEIEPVLLVAGERYKSIRDPLWAELSAGSVDLTRDLFKALEAEAARAYALTPKNLLAGDTKSIADVASRDRRLAGLQELRREVENYWKLPDSEGEIRSRFEKALARVPKVTVTRGPMSVSEVTDFALTGGGQMTSWIPGRTNTH